MHLHMRPKQIVGYVSAVAMFLLVATGSDRHRLLGGTWARLAGIALYIVFLVCVWMLVGQRPIDIVSKQGAPIYAGAGMRIVSGSAICGIAAVAIALAILCVRAMRLFGATEWWIRPIEVTLFIVGFFLLGISRLGSGRPR